MAKETKRQRYNILKGQLEQERGSFVPTWRDISEYVIPRRSRFFTADVNKGDRRSSRIVDSTATLSLRTLRSGMMSGITSPARPWFRLTTPDPKLAEHGSVKEWLSVVESRMRDVFLRSNLYNALPSVYGDTAAFATGAMMMEEDFDDVVRFYTFPIGSYMIATDERGRVNVFFREFRMTVRQLISKFGEADAQGKPDWSKFSATVKNLFDNNQLEAWIDICHVIAPNPDFDESKLESKYKRFASTYYETGGDRSASIAQVGNEDTYLSEKGYDFFPVMAPRWEVTGEDSYGTNSPGIQAMGDIKQLQLMNKRLAQAVEKMVNPPMVADPTMKNVKASTIPGDISYVAENDGKAKFRPAYQVDPRINELVLMLQETQNRIKDAFFVNAFLMMQNMTRSNITAREVEERFEEKLLILGPMLEQMNQDLHTPLIENTFQIMLKQSTDAMDNFIEGALIPEPPEELQGVDLKIEFVSMMAQAQKLVGVSGVERMIKFTSELALAKQDPTVWDKVDTDQTLDVYGDLTSAPPGLIRSDEAVEEMRAARQEVQAQAEQQQQLMAATEGAKNLAGAELEKPSALKQLLEVA